MADPEGSEPPQDDTVTAVIAFLLLATGVAGALKVFGLW